MGQRCWFILLFILINAKVSGCDGDTIISPGYLDEQFIVYRYSSVDYTCLEELQLTFWLKLVKQHPNLVYFDFLRPTSEKERNRHKLKDFTWNK